MSRFRLLLIATFALLANTVKSQITVDISASATEGCGSLQVNFCDNSVSTAGNIISWSWNLGGVTSNNECQGRIFGTPGTYDICLSVTDDQGNSEAQCFEDYITVHELPAPDFTASPIEGCVPHTAAFFNQSSSSSNIVEYIWGVEGTTGVAVTSGGAAPDTETTYNLADKYTISLTVTDENGCSNFISKEDYITVFEPPMMAFHADVTFKCEPNLQVNFINDNPDPNITYTWSFGNGISYQGQTPPSVLYTQSGAYTVTLIGENQNTDCRDTLILEDYINIGYAADFSFTPASGCRDLSVSFTDESPEAAGSVVWDFGDGSPVSNAANPTHVYTAAGIYSVTLTRTVDGCENFITQNSIIEVYELPEVAYNNDNAFGCTLPHTANFTGVSSDAISWFWDFGDGTTSDLQNPSHTYTDFGEYNVTLTVTDDIGCENTISTTNISLIETEAVLTFDYLEGCTPLNFTLSENSNTVIPINSWSWTIETPSGTLFSADSNPNFIISDTGCYDVILEVVNLLNCSSLDTFENAICVGMKPDVDFEAIPTTSCVEDSVFFNDLSSDYVQFWFWDFGDTTDLSFDQNPFHVYTDTGYFDLSLGVAHYGCFTDTVFNDYIHITEPIAKYAITQNCIDPTFVEFENISIGADSIVWDFGVIGTTTDTSTLNNPFFIYPDTGTYFVTLTAYNFSTGCEHIEKNSIRIHDPLAEFSLSPLQGCAPFTVNVTSSSIHALEYAWSSQDGIFSDSAIAEPNITFANAGTYSDIELIVMDVNGCTDTLNFPDTILVNEVTADFTLAPAAGCIPLDVNFTDQSTNLHTTNIEWEWTFDMLGTGAGQNTDFTFDAIGSYDVTLTVTDDWGCEGSTTMTDAVYTTQPTASFTGDTLACTQAEVSFTSTSMGDGLTYLWDFGNGETSSEETPIYSYPSEGTYTICLNITDVNGCESSFCQADFITIANPNANFSLDNGYAACPPLIVTFENLSENATFFEWDFGDGSGLSDLEAPPHVYTTPGVYDVTLIAGSTASCSDTFTISDIIVLDGPIGEFSFEIDSSCAPMAVTFIAESPEAYTYIWDFGDGSTLDTVLNSSADTTIYFYQNPGNYTPSLGIVDAAGCERFLQSPDSIFVPELNIDFQATDTVMCDMNNPVTFLNLVNSTDAITDLSWNFQGGDPSTSTEFEPTVNFDNPGLYDVMLVVENGYCRDSLIKENYIRIGDVPEAAFILSENNGCEPFAVTFTDITDVINGTVQSWHWDFGDGFESLEQQPTHTFYDDTSFEVTLVVTTDVGCMDTISQMVNMFLRPDVELSASKSEICINEPTQLQATFTSDSTGVNYYWEPSPSLSCTDCLDPIAMPGDTTTYVFVAESAQGCISYTEITIDVIPFEVPVITLSNDTLICANDVVQLFVSGGDNLFAYQWDNSQPGLTCYNACINPIASPEISTNYTVTVTNTTGCSSSSSVLVEVLDQFQNFVGEDRIICEGDTAHLNITTGNNPVWLVTNDLNCSQCYEAIASPSETTDYVAQVTTDEGCEIMDSIRVTVLHPGDINAGEDLTLCRDGSVMLDGMININDPSLPISYSWVPTNSLDNPNIMNPEAFPSSTTVYNLIIESGDCILRDSVTIDVVDKTIVEIVDATICVGDSVEMEVIGQADVYQWSPSEGLSNPNIANPMASPDETTTYSLVAMLSTCEPDTAVGVVEVDILPEAYLPPVFNFFEGQEIELTIENTTLDFTYQWQPTTGLSCADCPNPKVTPTETTNYSVTITDVLTGCTKTSNTTVMLNINCGEDLISVPNIFTPNGDGENDMLEIKYSPSLIIDEYYFRVFDRWGGMIFETTDINEPWDGTSGGQKVSSGVYIFLMEFPCHVNGSIVQKKGDISIVR